MCGRCTGCANAAPSVHCSHALPRAASSGLLWWVGKVVSDLVNWCNTPATVVSTSPLNRSVLYSSVRILRLVFVALPILSCTTAAHCASGWMGLDETGLIAVVEEDSLADFLDSRMRGQPNRTRLPNRLS